MFDFMSKRLHGHPAEPSLPILPRCVQSPREVQSCLVPRSPFSTYADECHTVERFPFTSAEEINFLIGFGYIDEVDFHILELINEYRILTSLQLWTLLSREGLCNDRPVLQRKLKRLSVKSILNAIHFSTPTGRSSFRLYTIGFHGRGLLKTRDIIPQFTSYISAMPTAKLKSIAAINQFLLGLDRPYYHHANAMIICKRESQLLEGDSIVRTGGLLSIDKDTYMLDAVRRGIQAAEDLAQKLLRYDKVCKYRDYAVSDLPFSSTLILICEDPDHICETAEIVDRLALHQLRIHYTCDSYTSPIPNASQLYQGA